MSEFLDDNGFVKREVSEDFFIVKKDESSRARVSRVKRNAVIALSMSFLSVVGVAGIFNVAAAHSEKYDNVVSSNLYLPDPTRGEPTKDSIDYSGLSASSTVFRKTSSNGILSAFRVRSNTSRSSARLALEEEITNNLAEQRSYSLNNQIEKISKVSTEVNAAKREDGISVNLSKVKAEQNRIAAEKKKAEETLLLKKVSEDMQAYSKSVDQSQKDVLVKDLTQLETKLAVIVDLGRMTITDKNGKVTTVQSLASQLKSYSPASAVMDKNVSVTLQGATTPIAPGIYKIGASWGSVGSWARWHTGQDFPAAIGTPVRAVADGVISTNCAGCEGWAGDSVVIIHHADETSTLYAHLADRVFKDGDIVKAGQIIGHVGMKGRTFGPHLHFEHYPKGATPGDVYSTDNPLTWLLSEGVHI